MRYKVWNEITFPFPNFHYAAVEVWPALVQVTAWRRRGDKPLIEPMLT